MSEEGGRVFLRGLTSDKYDISEQRRKQRSAPRVVRAGTVTDDAKVGHSGDSDQGLSKTWWMLGPGQHFADGDEPLRLLVAQNRIFKHLGYDSVVHLEDAKAGKTGKAGAAAAAR